MSIWELNVKFFIIYLFWDTFQFLLLGTILDFRLIFIYVQGLKKIKYIHS